MSYATGGQIVIIPSGDLSNKEICLQAKAPDEAVFYQFSLINRLGPTDNITEVFAYPGDDDVLVDQIMIFGQAFKVRISGGIMNMKCGIRFAISTTSQEKRSFDVTLPIAPSGIVGRGCVGDYIIGSTGPVGPQGEQGEDGKDGQDGADGITPTVLMGSTTTLDAGQEAVVTATKEGTINTLYFSIPKGDQGEPGADGADGITPTVLMGSTTTLDAGQEAVVIATQEGTTTTFDFSIPRGEQGESYINDGTTDLNVRSLHLGNIQSVKITDVPDRTIMLNSENNQLVIKQNNQWVPLNMSNFEIETDYKNNTGTFPLNFTPDKLVGSSDIVSGTTGVTAGYLSLDTSKTLIMPTTTFIRVDFKISSTDTTDADYYIAGFSGNLNIRINPKQKTISVYANNTTKIYSVDYTALGINLHDDKFHTLYFLINCSYKGYTAYALDGHYFNQSTIVTVVNLTLENLRFRGATSSLLAPADVLTIKNIVLSSTLPSQVNNQAVETKFDNVEGLYSCISNDFINSQLKNGILLKPNSTLDSVNSLKPYYTSGGNESLFNSDGLYAGVMSLNTTLDIDTFTLECYFKYDSSLDTDITISRSILGNINESFKIGIPYNQLNMLSYTDISGKNIVLDTNITKDVWHTLAISVNKSVMNIFIDGQLKATTPYKYNLHNLYIRSSSAKQYIPKTNALTIKNVSFLVSRAKYFEDYDSSLTPTEPGDDGFFYALSNSLISNGNQTSPIVNLILGADGEVTLMTLPNNETPSTLQLPKIAYDADNKPSLVNTKLSNIFMYNITGNPVKESV